MPNLNETTPLLRERDHISEDEEEEPRRDPRSTGRWIAFWVIFSLFTGYLVYQAFKEGNGKFDWEKAWKKAIGGGVSGALAMVIQVLTLMPLRTIMNYQYRYGGNLTSVTKRLYEDGGYWRFYSGLVAALFQGPLARFGDTFANAGILALLSSNPYLKNLPSPLKTAFASLAGAGFRMVLVPIDTMKTTMQTNGDDAITLLKSKVKAQGIGVLWYGAWATALASFVGSFPWFATYNFLQKQIPPATDLVRALVRQAFIGFVASIASDTISNSIRVLKTYRQVHQQEVGYIASMRRVISVDGWQGLFGRGLKTRLLCNALQGIMFSVLWKVFSDWWERFGKLK